MSKRFNEIDRSQKNLEFFNNIANERDKWIECNRYFYEEDWKYFRFLIPEGRSVLEVGCGTGQLLQALNPSHGVGIDFSEAMVEKARTNFSQFVFYHADAMIPESYKDIRDLSTM
jgi:ubiquinone/menaquinone biosynthesis C-methylase UbiE